MRARAWRHLMSAHRSERGQMIVLFVAIITIFLAFMAFAIDQGFWLGRRRVAQTTADVSARGGATAFFGDEFEPCEEAAKTAERNGIEIPNPDWCNDDPNPTDTEFDEVSASGNSDCVLAQIDTDVTGLFTRVFGIDEINVSADATACAGAVTGVRAWAGDDGPDGIAVVLGPGGPRDCFAGGDLAAGVECVIWGDIEPGIPGAQRHNRYRWSFQGQCDDGTVSGSGPQISAGVAWSCEEGDRIQIRRAAILDTVSQIGVLNAFAARLQQPTTCNSNEEPNSASFRNAFGNADGSPSFADPPAPFPGGAADPESIYVQNDCFDNPRLVILPITTGSIPGNPDNAQSRTVDISGFAVVYITGCYEKTSNVGSGGFGQPNSTADVNDCSVDELATPDVSYANNFTTFTEVRGVPIRVFITQGAIGGLTDIEDTNFPLSIQTVE
jgi:hypothetical protein